MKMKLVAFLLCLVVVGVHSQFPSLFSNPVKQATNAAQGVPGLGQISEGLRNAIEGQWNNFQSIKQYASEAEKQAAKNTFIQNAVEVENFNEAFAKGTETFSQAVNQFADFTTEEFNKLFNGFKVNAAKLAQFAKGVLFHKDETKAIPESVDWRQKGAVSPVKFQGTCASCYAFSSTGALEGQHYLKTGKLVEFSPQSLMDCSKKYGNDGCGGGFTEASFEFAKNNKGVTTLDAYPYEAKGGECRDNPNSLGGECKGYGVIPLGDEKALEAAVANIGPIAVAIDASSPKFQRYKSGVYYNPKCGNKEGDLNHAVLLVGYGKEPNGDKYWIVKNSYGPKWGDEGYIKMAKDKNNHCGIATYARYPIFE